MINFNRMVFILLILFFSLDVFPYFIDSQKTIERRLSQKEHLSSKIIPKSYDYVTLMTKKEAKKQKIEIRKKIKKENKRSLKLKQKPSNDLKTYASTSLMSMLTLKLNEQSSKRKGKQTKANKDKLLQAFEKNIKIDKTLAREANDFKNYVGKHLNKNKKDISLKDMETTMKKYSKAKFNIDSNTFDSVKPIIRKMFTKITKIKSQK